MKYDIITVGSAVIDAFVDTGIPEIHKKMCYNVGTKIAVKDLKFATGGGGTNTAVSFSKLGLKTGYAGKLGKDENGKIILNELKKEKVDFLGVLGKEPTGFSVILDSKEHERTILTYRGANDYLEFSELPLKKLNTNWFYFSSMTGEAHETQEKLAEWARKKGKKIAFNPSSYLTRKGASYLKKILSKVYVLILNDEEARDLIPQGDLFLELHKLGPKIVCITYGKNGSKISDGNCIYEIIANKIKVAEKTGAGDAFASGFVSGLIKLNEIAKAAQIGTMNAESVIQIPGAKNGLLNWKKVEEGLRKGKVKVILH